MPSFARRRTSLVFSFASSALLVLAAACGSSDDETAAKVEDGDAGSVGEHDSGTTPETDAEADAESNDVVVRLNARYGFADNAVTEGPRLEAVVSATITAVVDGKTTTFQPTVREDGAFVFVGVPRASYVLETRRKSTSSPANDPPQVNRFPIDGARNVRLGGNFWTRQDTTPMSDATKLALSLQVPEGVVTNDQFSWVGVHSYFYRTSKFTPAQADGMTNVPTEGATSTQNWTFASEALELPYSAEASGLPVTAAKDDLVVFQTRSTSLSAPADGADPLDRFNPWKAINNESAIGVLPVPSPNFANDTTNTVTGTLTKPTAEHLTLDIHGSTYSTIREAAGYPKNTTCRVTVLMTQEAGSAGQEVFSSVAPASWTLSVSSKKKPVDLSCFPANSTTCNPGDCAVGCANATDGYLDPGDLLQFGFDAPRIYSTGMRDIYGIGYSYSRTITLDDGTTRSLTASASESRPKESANVSFSLEVGPVTDLRVAGQVLDIETVTQISDAEGPTVTFTAPTKGAPEYYRIEIYDFTPDLGTGLPRPRTLLQVGNMYTREPSLTVPKDVMRSGHVYFVRVSAVKDGWDFAERPQNDGRSFRTGIFSGAFKFGASP